MATATENIGKVTQVIGSTFDVQYEEDKLPAIYNAVRLVSSHKGVVTKLQALLQASIFTTLSMSFAPASASKVFIFSCAINHIFRQPLTKITFLPFK